MHGIRILRLCYPGKFRFDCDEIWHTVSFCKNAWVLIIKQEKEDGLLICFGQQANSKQPTMIYWDIIKAYIGMRMPLGFNLDQFQVNA